MNLCSYQVFADIQLTKNIGTIDVGTHHPLLPGDILVTLNNKTSTPDNRKTHIFYPIDQQQNYSDIVNGS